MRDKLRKDAQTIFYKSIEEVKPEKSVVDVLKHTILIETDDQFTIFAIGKAAWRMAKSASDVLGTKIKKGIVITKYGHSLGAISSMCIYEAGHPLSDLNTIEATFQAIEMAKKLSAEDRVLMLISGGGSALFEYPQSGITLNDIITVSDKMIKVGADIIEVNAIRKRLSAVKAGRFAEICEPANIVSLVLSDVIGNRLDSIASGPVNRDETTCEDVQNIIHKYNLEFDENIYEALKIETPKFISKVESFIISSVEKLCESSSVSALNLGYEPEIIATDITENTDKMAERIILETRKWAKEHKNQNYKKCFIYGGEMVVEVKGEGLGGRCQHFALKVASLMEAEDDFVVLAAGSDGTDGPTDAAGAIIDRLSHHRIIAAGYDSKSTLENFNAYPALKASGDLLITGPTGTNVNDVIIVLIENCQSENDTK